MKAGWVLVFIILSFVTNAQVSFRRDITLGKHRKSHGFGIDWLMVSIGRTRTPGGPAELNRLIIDFNAFRKPAREYNYQQLAERVYNLTPGIPPWQLSQPWVPFYLLSAPPEPEVYTTPVVKVRR